MFRRCVQVMALLLFSLAVRHAVGQGGRADLTGQVSDSTGAQIPRAEVIATDVQTGVSNETTTGAGGVYVLTNLRSSIYMVAAQATGFQKLVRTGVTLRTGERTRLDLK